MKTGMSLQHRRGAVAVSLIGLMAMATPVRAELSCVFGGTPPLSGISASVGNSVVNGGGLAAEDASKALGFDIRVAWRDGQNLPAPTVTGFQALAAEGAAGLLVNGTDPLLAAEPLGPRLETIVFNIAAVAPAQRNMNEFVFGNAVLADTEAEQIISAVKDVLGISKIAIVYDDNAFGGMFRKFLAAAAEKHGVTVTHSIPIQPGSSNLRPQLRPLADSAHKAIVLASTGITPGTAIRQAKEIGVNSEQWIGEQFTWVPDALKAAGAAANGAITTTPLFDRSASAKAKQFAEEYERRFGAAPDALAGRAYDAVYAMATAAKSAGSCSGRNVREALVGLAAFDGVTGTLDFTKRIAEGKLAWGRVREGRIETFSINELK